MDLNRFIRICLGTLLLLALPVKTGAFALMGPIQPWMQVTNGVYVQGSFFQQGDIGGPMCLSNSYRWNVPVVTYGFDASFTNFFGTNGVAAVESAFKILNDLPPASCLVPTNYPFITENLNPTAQAQLLIDLKSQTLSALFGELGLASPTRNIYVLKQWTPEFMPPAPNQLSPSFDWADWAVPDYVATRNYDPQTLEATVFVNNVLYGAYISYPAPYKMEMYAIDPEATTFTALADYNLDDYLGGFNGPSGVYSSPGVFYSGLTYDDAGGLAFLLSTNTIHFETLLPDVSGTGANLNSCVNGAWRPGVNKISFVPQPVDPQSGTFRSLTNAYVDAYITNGVVMQQQLQRVTTKPDILFCAGDLNEAEPLDISRTGATNWMNNADLNGNPGGEGPGIIRPGIRIVFGNAGRSISSSVPPSEETVYEQNFTWASYDGMTNPPVVYPIAQIGTNQTTLRLELATPVSGPDSWPIFKWSQGGPSGGIAAFQTSTNLSDWITLFTLTNNGTASIYFNASPVSAQRFYRLVPRQ